MNKRIWLLKNTVSTRIMSKPKIKLCYIVWNRQILNRYIANTSLQKLLGINNNPCTCPVSQCCSLQTWFWAPVSQQESKYLLARYRQESEYLSSKKDYCKRINFHCIQFSRFLPTGHIRGYLFFRVFLIVQKQTKMYFSVNQFISRRRFILIR